MSKRKPWVKIIILCWLSLLTLSSLTAVVAVFGLPIWVNSRFANGHLAELKGETFDTVAELHQAFAAAAAEDDDMDRDIFPRDLIGCVPLEDKWLVVCTYAKKSAADAEADEVYIYLAERSNGKYILANSAYAAVSVPLYPSFTAIGHLERCSYFQYEMDGKRCSIGIVCKSVDEVKTLYFDGIQMTEYELLDSLTGEPFMLCCAISPVTHSAVQKIFIGASKRHTIELK